MESEHVLVMEAELCRQGSGVYVVAVKALKHTSLDEHALLCTFSRAAVLAQIIAERANVCRLEYLWG